MIDYTKNFQYIDLPPIPESMYPAIHKSLQNYNFSKLSADIYQITESEAELQKCVREIFSGYRYQFDTVNVQILRQDLPWHKDYRRNSVCNFLIQTGGNDVRTVFRDEEIKIEPFRWHHLNVEREHAVFGIEPGTPRLAVCVFYAVNKRRI